VIVLAVIFPKTDTTNLIVSTPVKRLEFAARTTIGLEWLIWLGNVLKVLRHGTDELTSLGIRIQVPKSCETAFRETGNLAIPTLRYADFAGLGTDAGSKTLCHVN
jgi:hypothetical protein